LRREDREKGYLWAASQWFWRQIQFGTRNFISYNTVVFIFVNVRLFMMITNLFVIANVQQLRTDVFF
jgi:hypothetical protein